MGFDDRAFKPALFALVLCALAYPASATPSDKPNAHAPDQAGEQPIQQSTGVPISNERNAADANTEADRERKQNQAQLSAEWQSAKAAAESAQAAWYALYLSIGIGIPTLLAAGIAAYYTARSARHARENIDALHEAERAILHAQSAKVGASTMRDEKLVCVEFLNRGRSIARVIEFGAAKGPNGGGANSSKRWDNIAPGETGKVAAFPAPPRGVLLTVDCWIKYRSVGAKVYKSYFTVSVEWSDGVHSSGLMIMPGWRCDVTNNAGHPEDT